MHLKLETPRGNKGAGVEDDEVGAQNAPNVEVFEPGTKFALILVTHEIWATRNAKISESTRRSKARNE